MSGNRREKKYWQFIVFFLSVALLLVQVEFSSAAPDWIERASTPSVGGFGEALVGTGEFIYAIRCYNVNSSVQFWKYNPETNAWANLSISGLETGTFRNGTAIAWDDGNCIYALCGARYDDADRRLFYRYTISTDSWTQLANTPGPQGAGDAITWSGYDGCIYSIIGSNEHDTVFARYNPSSGLWETRASPPAGTDDGCSLVWVGGTYLYALRGEYLDTTPLRDFWRYDIINDNWAIMAEIPEAGGVGDGSSLLWAGNWLPAQANYIYALGGGSCWEEPGDNFYRYVISTNTWETLESLPVPVGYYNGSRLGFANDYIYYWQGTPSTWEGGNGFYCWAPSPTPTLTTTPTTTTSTTTTTTTTPPPTTTTTTTPPTTTTTTPTQTTTASLTTTTTTISTTTTTTTLPTTSPTTPPAEVPWAWAGVVIVVIVIIAVVVLVLKGRRK